MKKMICGISIGLVMSLTNLIQAGVILSPISASQTLGVVQGSINYVINQSSLSSGFISGVTDFDDYLAGNPLHSAGGFDSWTGLVPTGNLNFDLGQVYEVDRFALWNRGFSSPGIDSFDIILSLNSDFSSPTVISGFNAASPPNPAPAEMFTFMSTEARYIRLQVNSSHDFNPGIGEIAFGTADVMIPEPSSLILGLLGLFGVVVVRRRNK